MRTRGRENRIKLVLVMNCGENNQCVSDEPCGIICCNEPSNTYWAGQSIYWCSFFVQSVLGAAGNVKEVSQWQRCQWQWLRWISRISRAMCIRYTIWTSGIKTSVLFNTHNNFMQVIEFILNLLPVKLNLAVVSYLAQCNSTSK